MKLIAVASKFEAEFLFELFNTILIDSILPLKKYKTELFKIDSIKEITNRSLFDFLTKKIKSSNSFELKDIKNMDNELLDVLLNYLSLNEIHLAVLGIGSVISPLSLQKLLSIYNFDEILFLGSSASLINKKGDIIFCEEFLFENSLSLLKSFQFKGEFSKDLSSFCNKNSIIKGTNRSFSNFINIPESGFIYIQNINNDLSTYGNIFSKERENSLGFCDLSDNSSEKYSNDYTANSLDLELSYLAQVCKLNKIKFQAFKVITDNGLPNFSEIRDIYKTAEEKLLKIVLNFIL